MTECSVNNAKPQCPPIVTLRLNSGTLITTSITNVIPVPASDIVIAEQSAKESSMNTNHCDDPPQEIEDIAIEIEDSGIEG